METKVGIAVVGQCVVGIEGDKNDINAALPHQEHAAVKENLQPRFDGSPHLAMSSTLTPC